MGKIWRGLLFCLLLCGVMTTASGCGGLNFTLNPQELYSLPKLPSKYDALNTLLGEIIGGGAEYASPTSGTNIQVVQMMDLDSDGQEEALAFFRNASDEKPLKIYIFTVSDESYRQLAVIALPLSGPIIAVIALYTAVGIWNGYFDALIYINDKSMFPLQLVLRNILIMNSVDMSTVADLRDMASRKGMYNLLKYAVIVVSSLPLLIVYPFVQKYFVKGIMVGSVKG